MGSVKVYLSDGTKVKISCISDDLTPPLLPHIEAVECVLIVQVHPVSHQ